MLLSLCANLPAANGTGSGCMYANRGCWTARDVAEEHARPNDASPDAAPSTTLAGSDPPQTDEQLVSAATAEHAAAVDHVDVALGEEDGDPECRDDPCTPPSYAPDGSAPEGSHVAATDGNVQSPAGQQQPVPTLV